jgi:hypothetical protein
MMMRLGSGILGVVDVDCEDLIKGCDVQDAWDSSVYVFDRWFMRLHICTITWKDWLGGLGSRIGRMELDICFLAGVGLPSFGVAI